jgi:phospholipid transport system transporter-binding protein
MALTPIALPERLTMSEARATLARLEPLLAAAAEPVIDASALIELDTAAVALLLDCQRQAHARGRVLRVTGAPAKLSQLAQLYGVDVLLGLTGVQPASLASPAAAAAGGA